MRLKHSPPPTSQVVLAFAVGWVLMALLTGCQVMPASETPTPNPAPLVQLGVRHAYLLDQMAAGPLRQKLEACAGVRAKPSQLSIGHRGAPLLFPEHTEESYRAAARQGAGLVECDVTFTKDRELVCRHAQCDLHETTNILLTSLAETCREPFRPAKLDPTTGEVIEPATARCCTSDLTAQQFLSLEGKMEGADPAAQTAQAYVQGTPAFRTDLYASGGTLLTHRQSIALLSELNVKFVPELKAPEVTMPFAGSYSQADYARRLIDDYREAGIPAEDVWLQSFSLADISLFREVDPAFARQAVWLDARPYTNPEFVPRVEDFAALKANGLNIIAPPLFALLALDDSGNIVPSAYAAAAREAGLELKTWTLERSGRIVQDVLGGGQDFYYLTVKPALTGDGDIYQVLDVLVQQAGVTGVFSDWPATVTYYANCMGL